ncbi:MAG TPA: hypothetical protein VFZ98_11900 [Vicinamibacterales bacterium]
MSSATSTNDAKDGFTVSHLFVLLSLVAATIAVVLSRPSTPESLILISLTIGAAGFAAVCFYRALAPLIAPHTDLEAEPVSERLRADLEREKALTLRSIKELEFDRAMGKLSQHDFDQMAGRLRARAIGIMKQLDAGTTSYRQAIERDLATRLAGKPAAGVPAASVPANAASTPANAAAGSAKAASADAKTKAGARTGDRTCACGVVNDEDARFCKSCGGRLATA